MKVVKGGTVKLGSGRRVETGDFINSGGQGMTYHATEVNSGKRGVLKLFHKKFNNEDTRKRIRFIMKQNLKDDCPVIEPPLDILDTRETLGHYTPYVGEHSLEECLEKPSFGFGEGIQLALSLSHALSKMHGRKIAHGDLQSENIRMEKAGSAVRLHIIDLDNFTVPGIPHPPCVGHNLYMAPELREALANKRTALPSVETDLFSLGVLNHELLLLSHPSQGSDDSEADFHEAMTSGRWLMDPAGSCRENGQNGGYPPRVLNARLSSLFRRAFSRDPKERPCAESWKIELLRALDCIYSCPECGAPFLNDSSKTKCPLQGHPFPGLRLHVNGSLIPLTNGAVVLGRNELGGSQKISVRHAVFRRVGVETTVESLGVNGTYRFNGSDWVRLPEKMPLLIRAGDRLRFGDAEAWLEEENV